MSAPFCKMQDHPPLPAVEGSGKYKRRTREAVSDMDVAADQLAMLSSPPSIKKLKTNTTNVPDLDEIKLPKVHWTSEEDKKLVRGVKANMSIREIAEQYFADGSRSEAACESRWNKHLKRRKMQYKSSDEEEEDEEDDDSNESNQLSWTTEEDYKLRAGVAAKLSFKEIVEKYLSDGSRGLQACSERWKRYMKKGKGNTKSSGRQWTPEESQKVLTGRLKHYFTFEQIAANYFLDGSRTETACEAHWHHVLKKKHGGKTSNTRGQPQYIEDSSNNEEKDDANEYVEDKASIRGSWTHAED